MFTVSSNQFTPQYQRIFLIRRLCRSSRNSFKLRRGSFVNTVRRKSDDNSSLSISDCKDICWKNCSCSGVTTRGKNANNTGCAIQVSSGTWSLIILPPVGFVSMMGLAGLLWYLRRRKLREEKYLYELLTLDSTNDTPELENDGNKGHNLKVLDLDK
ncbi:PAN-LIKE DOMAIN PROTEIN [Salix koriyanagi]|uniref:PAN-LIKE DOMAIN PROTEIN n=1 Tax=Salix koriyanagi TaxID=2511006 RepID=A0A9Q0WZM7_9ROSI|nr:PAN-LIKE DOMAIN PROTEIN [Salix koriyanagi]